MRLHQELRLNQAWLTAAKLEPGQEQPKVVLQFRTELTREVADAFGCLELIYAGQVPRSGVESMRLEGEEHDCEVELDNDGEIRLRVVADFLGGYSAVMEGTGPKLKFHINLAGYEVAAAELIRQVKTDPIKLTLRPAQMELPLEAEAEAKPGEGVSDFMQEIVQ